MRTEEEWIRAAIEEYDLKQTAIALPLAIRLHEGQTRCGGDVPYICHPLMVACHALALGFAEDALLAAALLHDTVEDCQVRIEDLPVSREVRDLVSLLSFSIRDGETKEEAKERYFKEISGSRSAALLKGIDRCNNVSSMAGSFSEVRMQKYMAETGKYILPMLDKLQKTAPDCRNAVFLLKYQIVSILESLEACKETGPESSLQ